MIDIDSHMLMWMRTVAWILLGQDELPENMLEQAETLYKAGLLPGTAARRLRRHETPA